MFLGVYDIDEYVAIPATTHRFSSGAAYQPTALVYSIYEEGGTTGLDEDVDMTPASPFDAVIGAYLSRRQLTSAAGFERGKTYVVAVKATVDSVAAVELHTFQIRATQSGDAYARIGTLIADIWSYGTRTLTAIADSSGVTTLLSRITGMTATAESIKIALEADGSKLDHLWETTEDDSGTRRFTTNALENAPAGGGSQAGYYTQPSFTYGAGFTTGITLVTLLAVIKEIIQDGSYLDAVLIGKINSAVAGIAAGIRMPDGKISPPLPDLFTMDTITTSTTLPYVAMPAYYQRKVVTITDSSGKRMTPPSGGDYYSFALFMKQAGNLNLTDSGSINKVAVKGTRLFYQGIPTVAETLGIHYYRKPMLLVDDENIPDGIPDHLQERLIKHYVCKEIFGEAIEDGQDNVGAGTKYHTAKFYEAMTELVDYIGIDAEPTYYGTGDSFDGGACD